MLIHYSDPANKDQLELIGRALQLLLIDTIG